VIDYALCDVGIPHTGNMPEITWEGPVRYGIWDPSGTRLGMVNGIGLNSIATDSENSARLDKKIQIIA